MDGVRKLLVHSPVEIDASLNEALSRAGWLAVPAANGLAEVLAQVQTESFAGAMVVADKTVPSMTSLSFDPKNSAAALVLGGLLDQLPDGLLLLDERLTILWANDRFRRLEGIIGFQPGSSFYDAFGRPEIVGPDLSPFHTAFTSEKTSRSTLRLSEKLYYQVQATALRFPAIAPVNSSPGVASPGVASPGELVSAGTPDTTGNTGSNGPSLATNGDGESTAAGENAAAAAGGSRTVLLVSVRDISEETLEQQKLAAVYQAGLELGGMAPGDLLGMNVDDRVDLLKARIIHYTKDLLEFETVEIRLLDRATGRLDPLLAVGMEPEACERPLMASAEGNGVTGFVAATGKSYLCEDTLSDPLYLPGAPGARSSLTVPLILNDEVIGTFNVESSRPNAFSEKDLRFLELFSREVAVALNTLELLVAEKLTTATESTERILREVGMPADDVLNDASWILERYIGHDPAMAQRLQRILKQTRDIKQLIHKVGESMSPKVATHSPLPQRPQRPKLRGKRVLVADNDADVRQTAHDLLSRFGCDVETAHGGEEALMMIRTSVYDIVLVDIRLPDMSGYDCFCQIQEQCAQLPVILMTGYGYDPGHSIVKCRQRGLQSVLYKPFRIDKLLEEIEKNLLPPPP